MTDTNDAAPQPEEQAQVPEPQQPDTPTEAAPQEEAPQKEEQPKQEAEPSQPDTTQEPDDSSPGISEYDISQYLTQQQEQPQFTPDEDGYIDPNQFYNRVLQDAEARLEQRLQFQEAERRAWQSIESKYPEVKEDPELRELIMAQRIADVTRGGKGDLNAIAGKVLGKIQSYQTRGKAQAQVSEKVQKSAGLEKPTANTADTGGDSELVERMSQGDSAAAEQLIAGWLEQGKL